MGNIVERLQEILAAQNLPAAVIEAVEEFPRLIMSGGMMSIQE